MPTVCRQLFSFSRNFFLAFRPETFIVDSRLLATLVINWKAELGKARGADMQKHESRHRTPFSDTPNGRIRRDQRRAAIAAKRAWLEM